MTQFQAENTLVHDNVTKLMTFMEEQRDKCTLMDQEMTALIVRDKEEAEKQERGENAKHSIHRSRLDELAATIAEQDARIRELAATIAEQVHR